MHGLMLVRWKHPCNLLESLSLSYLSIYLSVYLSIDLSLYRSIHLSINIYKYLSLSLFPPPSLSLSLSRVCSLCNMLSACVFLLGKESGMAAPIRKAIATTRIKYLLGLQGPGQK